MARLLSWASAAVAAAAAVAHADDAAALIQAQTDLRGLDAGSHEIDVAQIPGFSDMLKNVMPSMGGDDSEEKSPAPGIPGMPAMPMPTVQDIMKLANEGLKMLRNDTVTTGLYATMENLTQLMANCSERTTEQYTQLGETLASATDEQIIPVTSRFLQAEVLAVRPDVQTGYETVARFMRLIDFGNHSRQIKMGIAMAEPFLLQTFDTQMDPVIQSIQALGNSSGRQFCAGISPMLENATAAMGILDQVNSGLKDADKMVMQMKSGPLMLMAPDVVPKLEKLMTHMLTIDKALINHFKLIATGMNNTLKATVFGKLKCQQLLRQRQVKGRSDAGRSAKLAAPLFAAVALLLSFAASPREV